MRYITFKLHVYLHTSLKNHAQVAIEGQIEIIRQTTKEILKSKVTDRQFLIDAGITPATDTTKTRKKKKK